MADQRDDDGDFSTPEQAAQAVSELLDQHHHRASVTDGERMTIVPSQVLDNIALAMERLDNDIDTPVSIEEDVVAPDELMSMVAYLHQGPTLAAHVVNTAMRIMQARYPAELVDRPLPDNYDLRTVVPLLLDDAQHEVARSIFNQRTLSTTDLEFEDVADQIEALDAEGQIQVFMALFFMFGNKVGAMKFRTGIQ